MGFETVRLLIVVEDLDYRPFVDPPRGAQVQSGDRQRSLPNKLSAVTAEADLDASRAVDAHIFEAATYWRSHLQEVAIYSAYAPNAYSEVAASGVQFLGSGHAAPASKSHEPELSEPRLSEPELSEPEPSKSVPSTRRDHIPSDQSLPWPFKQNDGVSSRRDIVSKGLRLRSKPERDRIRLIADYCPTHVVLCTPDAAVISWTTHNQIPSVVLLSDWREPLGWWQRWQHQQLIKQLNHQSVAWIGSHGAYACKILCASGIKPQKLIPWEWPQPQLPAQSAPRQLRYERDAIQLIYVGPIHTTAGVDDLIQALSHLRDRARSAELQVICETSDEIATLGAAPLPEREEDVLQPLHTENVSDDILGTTVGTAATVSEALDSDMRRLKALIEHLDLARCVTFTPTLPEPKLIEKMRAADLVVLPGYNRSWPAATPPSLQLAMATRTPVIASDHDHFKEHLFHGVNAMIFPEGNAKSMAHRIERVMGQPQLYAQLSEALDIPLHAIKVPARWADLVDRWLQSDQAPSDGGQHYQQLCNWAFSSGRYQSITPMQKPPKGWKK